MFRRISWIGRIDRMDNQRSYRSVSYTHLDVYKRQLFNIYIDDLVKKWQHLVNPGIKLSRDRCLNVLLFADNLLVIQNTKICFYASTDL